MNDVIFEVCVFSLADALLAEQSGVSRLELCASPGEGGVTPSLAMIEAALEYCSIPVFPMIRPRGGDFVYSPEEIRCMKRDIEHCKRLGVPGVVFGVLTHDGKIDAVLNAELREYAKPMSVTFHRAFDHVVNHAEALEILIQSGFDRILTSGGALSVSDGLHYFPVLEQQSAGRITIMPGGGLHEHNLKEVLQTTTIREFHCSAKTWKPNNMNYLPEHFDKQLAKHVGGDFGRWAFDPAIIAKLRHVAATTIGEQG